MDNNLKGRGFRKGDFFLFNLDIIKELKEKFNWCKVTLGEDYAELEILHLSEYMHHAPYFEAYNFSEILYVDDEMVGFYLENPRIRSSEESICLQTYLKRKSGTIKWSEEDKAAYRKSTIEYISMLIVHNARVQETMETIMNPRSYEGNCLDEMKNHGDILNSLLGWRTSPHLIKLELEAGKTETIGWTDENIKDFLFKWSNKYYGGGRYEDEDVREVLKCYGVDSERLETALSSKSFELKITDFESEFMELGKELNTKKQLTKVERSAEMTVNLLRQSKTYILGQGKSDLQGKSKRVQHCDYVYLTELPKNAGFEVANKIIDKLESDLGITKDEDRFFNIQLVLNDMTERWTLRFSAFSELLEEEYALEI